MPEHDDINRTIDVAPQAGGTNVDSATGNSDLVNTPGEGVPSSSPMRTTSSTDKSDTTTLVATGKMPSNVASSRYKIYEEIARGGMGAIHKARDIELGRDLAIKVLLEDHKNRPAVVQRFIEEAQIGGQLQHPGVVPVYELGQMADQRPFFSMKLVKGQTLAALLADRKSPEDNRSRLLGIFLQVCQTLAYAHSRSVIHRDVKPANIMVGAFGEVQVMDWGLSKVLSAPSPDSAKQPQPRQHDVSIIQTVPRGDNGVTPVTGSQTMSGSVMGTPAYMAPEQALGEVDRLDQRADVFGLGAILCEIITGKPPYTGDDAKEIYRKATRGKLEDCHARLDTCTADPELIELAKHCLAPEPEQRPHDAGAVAERVTSYLTSVESRLRTVEVERAAEAARAEEALHTVAETAAKSQAERRARRLQLSFAAVVAIMAGIAGIAAIWAAIYQSRLKEDAQFAETRAESARKSAEMARDDANKTRNDAARQAAGLLLDRGIEDARSGEPARALHLFVRALRTLPADDPQSAPLDRVTRLNLAAWAETVPALEHIWMGGPRYQNTAYSLDGEIIAMAVGPDEVACFRTDNGRPVGPSAKFRIGLGTALAFAPDGRGLWISSPGAEKVVDQWAIHRFDPATGQEIQPALVSTGPIDRIICTPDGRYVVGAVLGLHQDDRGPRATASGERQWRTASIVVWEAASGRVVRTEEIDGGMDSSHGYAHSSYLSVSLDSARVTVWIPRAAGYEGIAFQIDGNEPHLNLGRFSYQTVGTSLHFQANLQSAFAIKDGQIHRWRAANPGTLGPGVPTPFDQMIDDPSPDGRSVCSPDEGRVFDAGAWPPRPTGVRFAHPGWQRMVNRKDQSPDGRFATTWTWPVEGDGRLWRLPRPHSRPVLPLVEILRRLHRKDYFFNAVFDAQAAQAILWWRNDNYYTSYDTPNIRLVDIATGAVRDTCVRHSKGTREIVFSPDGRHIAAGSDDATARVWDAATGCPAGPVLRHDNFVSDIAFSPDGATLAAGDFGPAGLIKFWNWRTGQEVRKPFRHDDIIVSISFSPDGRYLAATKANDWSGTPELLVWEMASERIAFRSSHRQVGGRLAVGCQFRPDSRALASRDVNGGLRLWDIPSGKLLGERLLDGIGMTRFSPDGRVIAASANLGVRLFDGATLTPLLGGFLSHPDPIRDLAFSPNGALLLTGHDTGSAQLWDVATCKPVGQPAVLSGPIRVVMFTPDGQTCVCIAADGAVRRWAAPAPLAEPDLERLAERVALMTGQRMDESQGLNYIPPAEWRSLREKLVGAGSTALVAPRPDAEWHDNIVADAEQDGDVDGAQWHLDRLAKLRPTDWTIPARRGRLLAAAGQRDQAAAAYDAAKRLAPTPQVLADWLRASASDDEAPGRKDAALWNLDRAIAMTPNDWTLYAARSLMAHKAGYHERTAADADEVLRRGADDASTIIQVAEGVASSGDWQRAVALFNCVVTKPGLTTDQSYYQALACLKTGDTTAYRAACARVAAQLPPIGPTLYRTEARRAAMLFALSANATEDWTKPLAWIDHALVNLAAVERKTPALVALYRQVQHLYLNTRGAVLYRAGQFGEAAKVLRDGMTLHANGGDFGDWLFLSLAEHRLGHADAAKEAAAKAREAQKKTERDVWTTAEVQLLAAELDAAMPRP